MEPNAKLNEQKLAERFGTSRGPIRDVLIKLTKEGLLVSKDNVGSSVSSPLTPELQKLSIEIRRKIEEHAVKQLENNTLVDEHRHIVDALRKNDLKLAISSIRKNIK